MKLRRRLLSLHRWEMLAGYSGGVLFFLGWAVVVPGMYGMITMKTGGIVMISGGTTGLLIAYIAFVMGGKFAKNGQYLFCEFCAFSLKGLPTKGICPECGNEYESLTCQKYWMSRYVESNNKKRERGYYRL